LVKVYPIKQLPDIGEILAALKLRKSGTDFKSVP